MRHTLLLIIAASLLVAGCDKEKTTPITSANVSIDDISMNEGNGGTSNMEFTVKLSTALSQEASVKVTTKDGFAKAAEDYQALNQVIVFKAGETVKKVNVTIVADDLKEGIDEFQVLLSDAVNCNIFDGIGLGVINNDDTKIPVTSQGYTTPESYPGKTLVWSDEFNASSLNTQDWGFDVGTGCPNVCGWGNNELQYYTPGDNLSFSQGNMIIEARKEQMGGKNYTSTRLLSMGKKEFKFGRIDIRAKLPRGQGIWPAFWMLGSNFKSVGWPACGEIDIMEFLGHEEKRVHSTIHYRVGNNPRNSTASLLNDTPLPDEYHVYSLDWQQDKIRMFIDDKLITEFNPLNISGLGSGHPFNEPFFFIFNIAVGGNWPGSPNATTYFPQWLYVDYIRVFQ
jgi:beta-glucanase (GH16 family)